jgi:hypothetical protein
MPREVTHHYKSMRARLANEHGAKQTKMSIAFDLEMGATYLLFTCCSSWRRSASFIYRDLGGRVINWDAIVLPRKSAIIVVIELSKMGRLVSAGVVSRMSGSSTTGSCDCREGQSEFWMVTISVP